MQKLVLLLLLFTSIILAQYTTPNTGVVWNMDSLVVHSGGVVSGIYPNYEVTNKVTVSANDKLTVLPGTTVNFINSLSGIDVNGRFGVLGTASDSVRFTSPLADSTGGYTGIKFNATAVDSECLISFASIKYADYGMYCIDASPTLENCYIYKCGRGVQMSTSNAKILNSTIERSYEYGILINLNSSPLLEGNYIGYNNTQATSAKNQVSIGVQGTNSPIVRNNVIRNGGGIVTGGLSLWVAGASSTMIAEGNEIYNNSFGITVYVTTGTCTAQLRNNIIYNNKNNPNQLISGSGINVNGIPGNTPVIAGNQIYGNWWGITIQNGTTVQAGPNPNIGNVENADTTDDGENIIYNNIQDTTHYDLYNNCTNDIYAQNNDWRAYDSTSIEDHIFHKVDDNTHGLVKFIPFSLYIPVELISFSAEAEGSSVILEWTTATENNNKGFEVQTIDNNTWETIGFITGMGTTTELTHYSFIHNSVTTGKHSYRLRQIDYNGSFSFLNEIEIYITAPAEYRLEQNYPNPFNPATTIKFNIPEGSNGITTLKIFDILGNEVSTLVNEYISPGLHIIPFNAAGLSTGVYFYELRSGDYLDVKKMILMK